jgi:hypothetical protein
VTVHDLPSWSLRVEASKNQRILIRLGLRLDRPMLSAGLGHGRRLDALTRVPTFGSIQCLTGPSSRRRFHVARPRRLSDNSLDSASPSASAASLGLTDPLEIYRGLVASGKIHQDESQLRALVKVQMLFFIFRRSESPKAEPLALTDARGLQSSSGLRASQRSIAPARLPALIPASQRPIDLRLALAIIF